MYLKGIEIQGFKSFADKISLDFNKGITAIVGPNGSGKSNISDAILWVLGEQSAKTLRGSKMEDIIFAGTEKRKALGFAEVSLLLDNSMGLFPLDFPEIKVTRKVYRSGESEYMINGTACRLKDIHELFMDTGLGRDGYSIIGQGKISDILSSKSENRRQMFEEAAGITKYKYRKVEAEKKLAQTKDNLIRLKDIVAEIETQITPLKAQSEKAKKYLAFYEKLKELEIGLSVISIGSLRADIKKIEADIDIYENQLNEIKKSTDEVDAEISQMYQQVQEFDKETEELRLRESDEIQEANELNNKIEIYQNNIRHNEENISRLSDEIESNKAESETLNTEKAQLEKELKEVEEKLNNCNAEIEKVLSELKGFEKNHSESLAEIESIKSEIDMKKEFITYETARIDNGAVLKQNLNESIKGINDEISQKNTEKSRIEKEMNSLNSTINDERQKYNEANSRFEDIQRRRAEISAECDGFIKTKNELILSINRSETNRNLLMDMDNELNGYSKSVKGIMLDYKKGKLQGAELYGPLSMLMSTEQKYVTAIEVALGAAGQNIVTNSEEDAKIAIEYLKKMKLGRVTFLPISAIKGRILDEKDVYSQQGFISIASELVKIDAKFSDIIKNILGKTVVVDNMDNAIRMSRQFKNRFRIVTLSGEILQAGGAITGGSVAKSNGFLSRSAEIEKLNQKIEEFRRDFNEISAKISKYTDEISSIDTELKECQKQKNSINENVIQLQLSYNSKRTELTSSSMAINALNEKLQDTQDKLERLDDDFRDGSIQISEKEAEISVLEEKLNSLNNTLNNVNSGLDSLNENSRRLDIEKNNLSKDIEVLNEKISVKDRELTLNKQSIEINENELSVLQNRIKSMNDDIIEFRAQLEKLEENSKSSKTRIKELDSQKKAMETKIREYQDNSKSVRETLLELTDKKNKQENRRNKLEYDLESIINHIWDEYEITYNDMLNCDVIEISNVRQANKDITDLKQQIKSLGSININSIEEYKTLKERYEFLSEQIADLDEAKEKLEKAISETMSVMKQQFEEKFAIINTKFNSIFKELFGGGRARLELTDPENVLDSGIEIEAQPPGKKLQSLTLLSGGESAFTAIALLFAILEVRPTPFCILDEIEAALDDVNVYRYADYLKKYCSKTQFIVVTHRRGTMEAANILYGVTMQEKGISKLLALNIDEVAM